MSQHQKQFLLNLYSTMLAIRLAEESLVGPITTGEVGCPCHLCSGQEAVAAGVCAALKDDDQIFGNHRSHGHYLAKGGDLNSMMAEIYGKSTGCAKGRGGSMHLVAPEKGMLGAAPIVSGTIALATGAALASCVKGEDRVAVSFFGDGATGEGVLYESLNFAALKKLPIIFVCENNFYSTHMSISDCRPNDEIYKMGQPLGITSKRVEGNDVVKVYETAQELVDLCRRGEGPALLECVTYRMRGHVGPDDNIQGTHTDIRPPKEIEEWKHKDPVVMFERYLVLQGLCSSADLDALKNEADKKVTEAHAFAKKSPLPQVGELKDYVYADKKA